MQAFVAAGLGVAVIPGLAVARPIPGVEVRRLRTGAPVRHIGVVHASDGFEPAAVTAMVATLETVTRRWRPAPAARRPA